MSGTPFVRSEVRTVLNSELSQRRQLKQQINLITHSDGILQRPWRKLTNVEDLFTFTLSETRDRIMWHITPDRKDIQSISGKTLEFSKENFVKTRHELCVEYFTGSLKSDAKWSILDPELGGTTPDDIVELGDNTWLVFEIATTKGNPYAEYSEKYTKYMTNITKALEHDPNKIIYFWIVIVTPNEVLTTFQLPSNTLNELNLRFKIGIAMEDVMIDNGLMSKTRRDESEEERVIRGSLTRLSEEPVNGHDQIITEDSVSNAKAFEANLEYCKAAVNTMFEETKRMTISMEESKMEMESAFQEVEAIITKSGGVRTDGKSPIQMPLLLAERVDDSSPLTDMHIMLSTLPPHIDHLWREANFDYIRHPERFHEPSLQEEIERASREGMPENVEARSQWHRVEIDISDHKEILALDGLQGKRFKKEDFKKMRREHQARGFSVSAPVEDIHRAVSMKPGPCAIDNIYWRNLTPLIRVANKVAHNDNIGLDVIDTIMSTDIALSLCQISAIAVELAVSLRQHVKHNGWIVKRVKGYKIDLLVKPTNSESHVFFLIRFQGKPLEQGTFRRVHEYQGWYYTDLLSINQSRLDNMIKSPVTYLMTLMHFRINVDRVDKEEVAFNTQSGYSERMAMITLLISLEDKAQTEEMALNVRYLVMQFSKGPDPLSLPEVGPVILKTPNLLRSRLAVYLFQQIKTYCRLQWMNLPIKMRAQISESDHSADQFNGLLCPFTHMELKTFYDIVQGMYIGYSRNKDSSPEQNSDFGMLGKIAKYVINIDPEKEDVYSGKKDPDPGLPGPHEYSPSMLLKGCKLLEQRFRNDYGRDWQSGLEKEVINSLIKATNHEAVATMKASADFSMDDIKVVEYLETKEEENFRHFNSDQIRIAKELLELYRKGLDVGLTKERWAEIHALIQLGQLNKIGNSDKGRFKRVAKSCKCHEAVIKELKEDPSTRPLLVGDYVSIFKSVMGTTGGICCYLFKKNQHGGLREIYVLTMKSRLLQLLPEVAAKTLCHMCPEEVLTHPRMKIDGYEVHNQKVAAATGRGMSRNIMHRTSSEDKQKWSQGMNVSAFCFMLSRLLPEYMANAIARVLHAFRNKKILVPEGVLSAMESDVKLNDETYMELKDDFKCPKGSNYFVNIRGKIFFKTPSGMWQGILHYCSSLLHVVQTVHYKALCRLHYNHVNKKTKSINKDDDMGILVCDTVVSSDDSASYFSIILPEGASLQVARRADEMLDFLLKLECTHSRFFMMVESTKSCISSKTVGEFNSIFSCGRTYISPAIKKVLAACTIPENEDLESRQIVLSNMMKDMIEEGCTHFQVHLSEILVSYLHYLSFGLSTSRLFIEWSELIQDHPDPALGFFLMDLQDCAGAMGYDFKKYNSLKDTQIPIMPSTPTVLKGSLEGSFNTGVVLTMGDRRRWETFANRVVTPGWEAYLEENPHCLYMQKGVTKEEIQARLSAKACSKGVHESLKANTSLTRVISTSVYLLSRKVVSIRSLTMKSNGNVKETEEGFEKRSLLSLTISQMGVENAVTHAEMTEDQKYLLYPNNRLHDVVSESLRAGRTQQLVKTVKYRCVRNKIEIRSGTNTMVLPIMTVLRWKWLKTMGRHSRTNLEQTWSYFRNIFHWLDDDIGMTLIQSPFTSHLRLFGFFQTVDKKSSRLSVLTRRIKSNTPYDQIIEMANHNQYPEMRRVAAEKATSSPTASQNLMTKASLINSVLDNLVHSPAQGHVKDLLNEKLSIIDLDQSEKVTLSTIKMSSKSVCFHSAAANDNLMTVSNLIINSGQGVIKTYIQPQERRRQRNGPALWSGPGRLLIKTKRACVEALVYDKSVVALKCKNIPSLQDDYNIIALYLEQDGFKWETDERISHYSDHFIELTTGNITDWTCASRGLIHIPDVKPFSLGMRLKQSPMSTLNMKYTIVIQSFELEESYLEGELSIEHEVNDGVSFLSLKNEVADRKMTLMKYYGPKRPRPIDGMKDYFSGTVDTESIMDCWLTATPLGSKSARDILKYALGESSLTPTSIELSGTGHTNLEWFIKNSFKWRAIGRYKIEVKSHQYLDDLVEVATDLPVFTRDLKDQAEEMALKYLNHTESGEELPLVHLEPVDERSLTLKGWLEEVEEHEPEAVDETISEVPVEVNTIGSDGVTEQLDIPSSDLKSTPSLFMSHPLWDNFIDKLEIGKIWLAMREGLHLSPENHQIMTLVCKILDYDPPKLPEIDWDSDDDV